MYNRLCVPAADCAETVAYFVKSRTSAAQKYFTKNIITLVGNNNFRM